MVCCAGYYVVADAAYTPTEHLVSVVGGVEARTPQYDAFNYVVSQFFIRIEMAYGLMCKKWGIFWRLCSMNMSNYKVMVGAVACLHNFCIDKRLEAGLPALAYAQTDLSFEDIVTLQHEQFAEQQFEEHQTSWVSPQFKFQWEHLLIKYIMTKTFAGLHIVECMQSSNDE